MHRLTVLYPPPADEAHFRDYYVGTHLPLAAKLPGLVQFQYSFDVAAVRGESKYFAVFHADFESAEAMARALGSEEGKAVAADVPNYATGGAELIHYPLG
ncbi:MULTISPECIES: EthD family reductase [Amycolatopsis]|uniref:Ethyl tert-butyl ether degradation protein EthD n=1 Tax=Amycolatopsis bullii TaxID=941987 RepID=A0ABQ3K7N4_9PSEU|nr:EthD family reductase [Amycolatopsis bullii]GHG02792.1 ethyl tert-butyl ether degradation protein EthD [Amycolatopsis bullii]